jgi:hypothetical protein
MFADIAGERWLRRMTGLARYKESELYDLGGGEGEEGSRRRQIGGG